MGVHGVRSVFLFQTYATTILNRLYKKKAHLVECAFLCFGYNAFQPMYRWVSTVFYGVRAASLQQAFINQPLERSTDLKNAYMIGITVNVLTDPQK